MSKLQQAGGMEASREIAQVPTYCADDVKVFVQIDVCIVGWFEQKSRSRRRHKGLEFLYANWKAVVGAFSVMHRMA